MAIDIGELRSLLNNDLEHVALLLCVADNTHLQYVMRTIADKDPMMLTRKEFQFPLFWLGHRDITLDIGADVLAGAVTTGTNLCIPQKMFDQGGFPCRCRGIEPEITAMGKTSSSLPLNAEKPWMLRERDVDALWLACRRCGQEFISDDYLRTWLWNRMSYHCHINNLNISELYEHVREMLYEHLDVSRQRTREED